MTTFKIGDRVKVGPGGIPFAKDAAGKEAKILNIYQTVAQLCFHYVVGDDHKAHFWMAHLTDIEPIIEPLWYPEPHKDWVEYDGKNWPTSGYVETLKVWEREGRTYKRLIVRFNHPDVRNHTVAYRVIP